MRFHVSLGEGILFDFFKSPTLNPKPSPRLRIQQLGIEESHARSHGMAASALPNSFGPIGFKV